MPSLTQIIESASCHEIIFIIIIYDHDDTNILYYYTLDYNAAFHILQFLSSRLHKSTKNVIHFAFIIPHIHTAS